MIHPWLEPAWQRLIQRQREDRLAHGLLLSGPAGIGKRELADAFARALLCEQQQPDGQACGTCHGCRMFEAGTHPDYQLVAPEEEGSRIKVDQIRDFIGFMALSRQYERYKVAIIDPADAMNVNAANSLLKTLEEPATRSVLMLVSAQPSALPATIRSRCQKVELPPPGADVASDWLQARGLTAELATTLLDLTGNAPLRALALHESGGLEQRRAFFEDLMNVLRGRESLPTVAEKWKSLAAAEALGWQLHWIDGMLRQLQAGVAIPGKEGGVLERLAPLMGVQGLFDLREQLIQTLRMSAGNLNAQLLLEDVLQRWSDTLDLGKRQSA